MKRVAILIMVLGLTQVMADGASNVYSGSNRVHNSNGLKNVRTENSSIELRGKQRKSGGSGESSIKANENVNLNLVNKSEVTGSVVGMKVRAVGSEVEANKNTNLNLVNKSEITDSTVGMSVEAE